MVPTAYYLMLSAALFAAGVVGVLVRRSAVAVFMAMGLMVNASLLSFAAFARHRGAVDGQVVALLVLAVTAAEAVVGLGLFIALFRNQKTADVGEVDLLKW